MSEPTAPTVARRMPPSAGPRNVPSPSAALDVTLAAMSCWGVRATHGRRAMYSGRVNAPAPASMATATYRTSIGAPTATAAAASKTPRARTALAARSTRSADQRATGRPANGARTVGTR